MKVGSERTISKGPKPCWEFKDTTRKETRAVRRGTRGGRGKEEGMVEKRRARGGGLVRVFITADTKGTAQLKTLIPLGKYAVHDYSRLSVYATVSYRLRQAVLVRQSLLQRSTLESVAVDPVEH